MMKEESFLDTPNHPAHDHDHHREDGDAVIHFVSEQKVRALLKTPKVFTSVNQFFQQANSFSIPPRVKVFSRDSNKRLTGRLVVFDTTADQNAGIIVIKPDQDSVNINNHHNQNSNNKRNNNNNNNKNRIKNGRNHENNSRNSHNNNQNNSYSSRQQDYVVLKMSEMRKMIVYDENHIQHVIQPSASSSSSSSSSLSSRKTSLIKDTQNENNNNQNEDQQGENRDDNKNNHDDDNDHDHDDGDDDDDDEEEGTENDNEYSEKVERERERGYELVQPTMKVRVRTEPSNFAAPVHVNLLYNTAGLAWDAEYLGVWKEDGLVLN